MNKIRKQFLILSAALLTSINFLSAQITFQKTFGYSEQGFFAQQTADGGYIVAGAAFGFGVGNGDFYLIKTNSNGDTLWTKTYGGVNTEIAWSGQQTFSGGYIIAGWTNSFGAGAGDVYLINTDANGDTLWTKTYGGTGQDFGSCVKQTTDGGYIVMCRSASFGAGGYDIYLIKTAANGDTLWTKTFGGTGDENSEFVQQTTDGGYILTGKTNSFGVGDYDAVVIKTDSIGNTLWTKTYGGAGLDEAKCIQQTSDAGYIIVGSTESFGADSADVYLIKTNASGDTLWTRAYGGTGVDYGEMVEQTTDGGYIITGRTTSFGAGNNDVYLLKTDSIGFIQWTKTFGGTTYDVSLSIEQTTDGGYIIAGYSSSFSYSFYLIKTDSMGNSGCYEGNTATITSAAATQITNPITNVSFPVTIVTSPLTIVGSGGNDSTLCSINVGINEIRTGNSFLISPNPSNKKFIISFERTVIKGMVEILNVLGKNIFAENIFNESKKEISLKNTSSGIYFVKVFDGENSYCKKLIVE